MQQVSLTTASMALSASVSSNLPASPAAGGLPAGEATSRNARPVLSRSFDLKLGARGSDDDIACGDLGIVNPGEDDHLVRHPIGVGVDKQIAVRRVELEGVKPGRG